MTAAQLKAVAQSHPYEDAADILDMLAPIARRLRVLGWTVNVAIETGPVERLTFSASLPEKGEEADV